MNRESLLSDTLAVAVPLLVAEMEQRGGPGDRDREWLARYSDSRELASRADVLLYRGKRGETAELFNNFARALAIMAFEPGGIRFAGVRYEPGRGCGRRDPAPNAAMAKASAGGEGGGS